MIIFENVVCNLCQSQRRKEVYSSKQYSNTFKEIDIKLVICEDCGFIYQNPQLTSEALECHYAENSSGNIYREYKEDNRALNLVKERELFLTSLINNSNIQNICDVGGGNGVFLSSLNINSTIKKILIEPSDAILLNHDPHIEKIKRPIESISLTEFGKFDMIMCISALEHFKNPSGIVKKFNELLDDDGYLFIEVPNSLRPYDTLGEFYIYEHLNHFTPQSLLLLLKKHDFYVVKMDESLVYRTTRVIVKKEKKSKEIEYISDFFSKYSESKQHFLNKLSHIHKYDGKNKISIYGAGEHTRFLLERFNILDKIEYFIDSDVRKTGNTFYGKKIISPAEIKKNQIKNILISSHDFELEIFKTIQDIDNSINIVTIYKDLE